MTLRCHTIARRIHSVLRILNGIRLKRGDYAQRLALKARGYSSFVLTCRSMGSHAHSIEVARGQRVRAAQLDPLRKPLCCLRLTIGERMDKKEYHGFASVSCKCHIQWEDDFKFSFFIGAHDISMYENRWIIHSLYNVFGHPLLNDLHMSVILIHCSTHP